MATVAKRVTGQGMSDMSMALAPLVVGVTGHRDLREEDRPQLQSVVQDVLKKLREDYPSTPLIVISPLAEGADRLVAGVALKMGAQLVVPLPLPLAMYEADFQDPDSLADFRRLLAVAWYSFEIPLPPQHHGVNVQGAVRDRQYEEMGKYIARESQIVIALWNGTDSHKTGGTAAIVKFQTEGIPNIGGDDLQPLELFPVYHIPTPRRSNSHTEWEAFQIRKIYPSGFEAEREAEDYYDRIFRNLDEFNRSILLGGRSLENDAARSKEYLISGSALSLLSGRERLTLHRYALADALAIRFQQRLLRAHYALHWWVFTAFLFFVLFAHLPGPAEHSPVLLGGALLILLRGVWDYRLARRAGLDNKCLDYRAVAEGCRVELFWQINGINEPITYHYLGQQRTELDWIRNGLRGWDIGPPTDRPTFSPSAAAWLDLALKDWVDNQRDWFKNRVRTETEKLEQMESRSQSLLAACLGIVTGLTLILFMSKESWEGAEGRFLLDLLIIIIDLLLAGGALLHHSQRRMARAEHIKQYKHMHAIFRNASQIICLRLQAGDISGARACLKTLGREALAENADWVLLHRERPLELPHP